MTQPEPPGTPARILRAALPLFSERGYDGTSTRMVAQAADVNVATIAYHFDGKEGLYHEVLRRLYADIAAALPTRLEGADPGALVDDLAVRAWHFARAHRRHIRLSVRHVLDRGRHAEVVMEEVLGSLAGRADQLLGALRPDWSVASRRLLLYAMVHAVVRFAIEDPPQLAAMLGLPSEQVDQAVIDFLRAMLRRELGLPPGVAAAEGSASAPT